jgi:hypothetical protein
MESASQGAATARFEPDGDEAMYKSLLLVTDAIINLLLGAVLLIFHTPLINALGVPDTGTAFYPSILGAVLIGIGLALLWECFRGPSRATGLGLAGAVCINLCGAIALAAWLAAGTLQLPLRGSFLLWGLVGLLAVISAVESAARTRHRAPSQGD